MFIAEIGINHNGLVSQALQMIDMVCNACERAGVSKDEVVVKFQKRNIDKCVPEAQKNIMKDTPWGRMTYYDYKKAIEFDKIKYDIIDKHCKEKGIKWTASVWDLNSAEFINENYTVPFIKIPSPKIVDEELLDYCNRCFDKVIMSTGMSTEKEIKKAISILDNCNLTIMHCNSSYPAKDEELNLNYILTLIMKEYTYHKTIGYSGHEEGISASIVAKTLGAEVIERHITLSRSMWGTDQAASITYDQLWRLLRDLNKIEIWKGDGIKKVYDSELPIKEKLR